MEEMNVLETVAENSVPMEAPVCETVEGGNNAVATAAGIAAATVTTIVVWEVGKKLVTKAVSGIKNFFASRKAAKLAAVEETIEVDCEEA
jgi:O-acetylhomoserine/O-acetylserine sulfhydrylase-like pyridoxal-dependent enzyme